MEASEDQGLARDATTGQFARGKDVPLDKRCERICRSTGLQCRQHFWRVTSQGKKICHFHDPSRKRYKGQKTNKMPKNYRNIAPALEALLGKAVDRSTEAEALNLLTEVQLMRASVEPQIAVAAMVLGDAKASDDAKQASIQMLQMAIKQVESTVQAAARVRALVAGVISPQQVREVVDQFISIVHKECGDTLEGVNLADRIRQRIWGEVKLPTGEGQVQGTNLTPADTMVQAMDASVPVVTEVAL